jgi:hypothetical protein
LPFFDFLSRKKPTLEEQLAVLSRSGILPNDNFSMQQLLHESGREPFEESPFILLLCALGDESELEPCLPLSNNVWHLDTECIENDGDYVRVAQRMAVLAGDTLELHDVEDHVDIEQGRASLSFTLDGQRIVWVPEINDDWVDARILSNFVELLRRKTTSKRFTYINTGGQDCLIGCATSEQFSLLRKTAGLKIEWLK